MFSVLRLWFYCLHALHLSSKGFYLNSGSWSFIICPFYFYSSYFVFGQGITKPKLTWNLLYCWGWLWTRDSSASGSQMLELQVFPSTPVSLYVSWDKGLYSLDWPQSHDSPDAHIFFLGRNLYFNVYKQNPSIWWCLLFYPTELHTVAIQALQLCRIMKCLPHWVTQKHSTQIFGISP